MIIPAEQVCHIMNHTSPVVNTVKNRRNRRSAEWTACFIQLIYQMTVKKNEYTIKAYRTRR
jgi:hypothetical protein